MYNVHLYVCIYMYVHAHNPLLEAKDRMRACVLKGLMEKGTFKVVSNMALSFYKYMQ